MGGHDSSPGLGGQFGREFMAGVETYLEGGKIYVITAATTTTQIGSNSSINNRYPVAKHPATGSFYRNQNSSLDPIIAITRFETTSLFNSLDSEEQIMDDGETLTIYPNPAKEYLFIESKDNVLEKIEIFDLNGKKVLTNQFLDPNDYVVLNVSLLENGFYIVKINENIVEKFIKH